MTGITHSHPEGLKGAEATAVAMSYEDAIRNAMSIGGDSDTIGAITGGIAGAYWGVPQDIREKGMSYLDEELKAIVLEFEKEFPFGKEGGK